MTDRPNTFSLITWNVRRGSARRWPHVAATEPDIAVLQECACPEMLRGQHAGIEAAWTLFWTGNSEDNGLLVAVRTDIPARLHAPPDLTIKHALAVEVGGDHPLRLLAVHSYNHRATRLGGSSTPLPDALARYGDWLAAPEAMVAGDFNNQPSFDAYNTSTERRPNRWSEIAATLRDLGLASAWHHLTGEAFGAESAPTHVHSSGGRFHIDYVFAARERLEGATVTIGDVETWVRDRGSDHVPIIVRLPRNREAASGVKGALPQSTANGAGSANDHASQADFARTDSSPSPRLGPRRTTMSSTRRPNLDFLEMGYRAGDLIAYGETGDKITVLGPKLLLCDGHEYSWTKAADYMKMKHPGTRGKPDFHFRGETVVTRYKRTYGD